MWLLSVEASWDPGLQYELHKRWEQLCVRSMTLTFQSCDFDASNALTTDLGGISSVGRQVS